MQPKGGAPTGKWPAVPEHLERPEGELDPSALEAKLIVRRPQVPDVEIALEKPEFMIGRQTEDVDLTLDDELVSRQHARLTMDHRGYFKLEDLGSRNGINYAGRVVRRLNLIDGDTFNIGKTEFVFHAKMTRFVKPISAPVRADSVLEEVPVPEPEQEVSSAILDPAEGKPGRE